MTRSWIEHGLTDDCRGIAGSRKTIKPASNLEERSKVGIWTQIHWWRLMATQTI